VGRLNRSADINKMDNEAGAKEKEGEGVFCMCVVGGGMMRWQNNICMYLPERGSDRQYVCI
jgi:hypothetical protein